MSYLESDEGGALLRLVLYTTSKSQAEKVLEFTTPTQALTVSEVCKNLLEGNLPLNAEETKVLSQHKLILRYLANPGLSITQRVQKVRYHHPVLTRILLLLKGHLLKVLKDLQQ